MEENQSAPQEEPQSTPKVDAQVFVKSRSKFPTVGDVFAMFGIFIAAELIATFAVILLGLATTHGEAQLSPDATGKMLAISSFVAYVLTFGGILIYRSARGGSGTVVRFSLRGLNPILILWGFLLLSAVGVVIEPLLSLLPSPAVDALGTGVWTMAAMIIFAPIFEELICRGAVLESLRAKYGVWIAWFVSALFFGAIHLQPQLVVNAFFIGLIFAFLYIRTNSLWIVMILHAMNNAVAYIAMLMGYSNVVLSDLITNRLLYMFIFGVAVVVCVISSWMIYRTLRRLDEEEKNRVTV
ncbi:MAG: type II CAAX endopeptidase family protein [Alistipes sp.]